MHQRYPKVEKYAVTFGRSSREFLAFALRVVAYGRVRTRTDDPNGEVFSFYHRLNYIVSGNPYYHCGGRRIELSPGCLVYLPPNTILEIEETSPPVELLFLNFEVGALDMLEEFRSFMEESFQAQHIFDEKGDLIAILKAIEEVGAEKQIGWGLEIQNLFENLLLHAIRKSNRYQPQYTDTAPSGGSDILYKAMNYINENLQRSFRMSELADHLNISENYLYKIFVSKTGKSPAAFIVNLRMETAKQALANPSLPVKTIAAHLGYPDVSHFSTVFKRECGVSPREYRRSITTLPYAGKENPE